MTNEREDKVRQLIETNGIYVIFNNLTTCDEAQKEELLRTLVTDIISLFPQPLSEEEILDFLDSWGYRHGNMPKCNDDDFRKIAQAISTHFCKPRISVEALERIIEGFRNKLPLMLIGYEETKLLAIAIHKRMEL